MLRISSRTVTYNPSGWKNVKSIFGRNKKQQKQLVDNLPQKEKEVYLRDRELEKRTAGFNWEETGRSLIYNRNAFFDKLPKFDFEHFHRLGFIRIRFR